MTFYYNDTILEVNQITVIRAEQALLPKNFNSLKIRTDHISNSVLVGLIFVSLDVHKQAILCCYVITNSLPNCLLAS